VILVAINLSYLDLMRFIWTNLELNLIFLFFFFFEKLVMLYRINYLDIFIVWAHIEIC
jgi:hypothetical protein